MRPHRRIAEHHVIEGAELAALDCERIWQEGPRMDARIGTLMTTLLGGLASAGGIGGYGGMLSRERDAKLALALLVLAAVVIVVGLIMNLRLILPRMTIENKEQARWPRRLLELVLPTHEKTDNANALKGLASVENADEAYDYYVNAAKDPLRYMASQAHAHANAITGRNWRFVRAGWMVMTGIVVALAGSLSLAMGW